MKSIDKLTKSNRIKHVIMCLLALWGPIVIMVAAGALIGMMPFSDNGFMVSDIKNQFAAFYTYFKSAVTSGGSITYSLSKTMGGSMTGFYGYYLINPFLFILFLFPNDIISVGIFYMLAVMSGFMSLTFYLMLTDLRGNKLSHLIFAFGYALSGYFMAYMTIPGFFCSLILLPLIVMGLNRMLNNSRRFVLYSISLAGAIICNYYIGYMICIFCVLYFLASMLSQKSFCLKKLFVFAGSSALGGIISMPVLIPTVLSLSGQKTSDLSVMFNRTESYQLKYLFRNLLPGQFHCDFSNGAAPYIYFGVSALICLILYFFNRTIALRERFINLLLLIFLVVCTYITGLDSVWHGFNTPVGFSHRQSFVIVFFCLLLAAKGLTSIRFGRILSALSVLLLITQIGELSYNAVITLREFNARENHPLQEYSEYYTKNSHIIDTIKSGDDGLYRIEKDYDYNHNDALLFGYFGLSHNSSCESDNVKQFVARLGLRNQGIWDMYNQGSTVFTDSLLGVKYFISRFDSTNKPYSCDFDYEGSYVFRNPYALPFAWITSREAVSKVDLTNPDLFEIQNEMAGCDIYTKVDFTEETFGLSASVESVGSEVIAESADDYTIGIKNSGPGTLSRIPENMTVYQKDGSEESYIDYTVTVSSDCNLYCYFTAPSQQGCELFVNGATRDNYFSDYRWNIINCGNYLSGDTVTVTLKVTGDSLRLFNAYFYEENIDTLAKWYNNITSNPVSINRIKDSYLKGTVNVSDEASEDSIIIFSLPYESGLNLYVDGIRQESFSVYDCLLGAAIDKGEHIVELKYY